MRPPGREKRWARQAWEARPSAGKHEEQRAAMKVVLFCHSLLSDWNHGNAHFLRGIVSDLLERGHEVAVYEPADSWSRTQLVADAGESAIAQFHRAYPRLSSSIVDFDTLPLEQVLADADLVLVHEWCTPRLVAAVGRHHARNGGY